MKERPILFTGVMVRALLAGMKTVTRRLCTTVESPFLSGDRLWVKETWRPAACTAGGHAPDSGDVVVRYLADGEERYFPDGTFPNEWTMPKAAERGNVTPLFMPRWASRITLEVLHVRREQLQEISYPDIAMEGVTAEAVAGLLGIERKELQSATPPQLWQRGWDAINGAKPGASWSDNPWVWRVWFRRIEESRNAA